MASVHDNLFAAFGDAEAAYRKLLQDQARDARRLALAIGLGLAAWVLAAIWPRHLVLFGGAGILAALGALALFTEMSNRNILLHMIDLQRFHDGTP